MTTWRNREELEHQVVTLDAQGTSRRVIARTCGISRNTVRRILKAHARRRKKEHSAIPEVAARAPRARIADGVDPRARQLLEQYPDITAQRVFETLREEGFTGGYTAIKVLMRGLRPKNKPAPSRATPVFGPGEMAESDWSPYVVKYRSGVVQTLQAFSYVLVFSKRKYFAVFQSNDLHALMQGHEEAFGRFEGCAHGCKYDSQKPVVLRWEGQQPIYNPRFLAFSTHYELRPHAVRGNPNAKPRVERSFWELTQSFFNGRSFADFADLQAQLSRWHDTTADLRKRYGTTVLDRFEQERSHLRPLPAHPYDTARVAYRLCSIDGFIDWQGNSYAVPYEHVTDILVIRVTQNELFVYGADLACIARHELAPRGKGLKLDPAGYHPAAGRRAAASDHDQLRDTFHALGDYGAEFFRLMSLSPARIWAHQARKILCLRERYSTEDLLHALRHAARYGALDAASVERILDSRSLPRRLDEYVCEQTAQRLAETLGMDPTVPRDLTEYDRIPPNAHSFQNKERSHDPEDSSQDR